MDWEHIVTVALSILTPVLTQGWSFLAVALSVYYFGQSAKNLAERKGWRAMHADEASWFDATLPMQPIMVGALLMQIPFPVWAAIDGLDKDPTAGVFVEAAARLAYGALAGALCGQIFEVIQTLLKFGRKRLGLSESGRATVVSVAPKMVPSSTVVVVTPVAKDPSPTSETLIPANTDDDPNQGNGAAS